MSAPGTAGAQQGKAGPVLATNVVVSHDNKSSQVKPDILPVLYAGDTSSFSDDVPVHLGGPFLAGGTQGSRPDRTGAGEGNAGHQPHPNAGK
jgi:hypothetical protein